MRDQPLITIPRDGCPFCVTSYRDDDHSSLNLPSTVSRVGGAPEPARPATYGVVPGRVAAGHAACNVAASARCQSDVIKQISLDQTATDLLHSVFGREFFPSSAVNGAATVPCILRALAHLAAMGLWWPPVGPGGPGLDTVHLGPQCPGCPVTSPLVTSSFPAGLPVCSSVDEN